MFTWPANIAVGARPFLSRKHELMERLRWAPHNSRRRAALEAELRALVRTELEREAALRHTEPKPEDGRREQWWQR